MQQKIQTFSNTCLRRIFNIRWPEKIRNEELWKRARQEPVAKQILRKKWASDNPHPGLHPFHVPCRLGPSDPTEPCRLQPAGAFPVRVYCVS
nr:hypothetical protein BaRGS_026421 [Batillaria attramentaria]